MLKGKIREGVERGSFLFRLLSFLILHLPFNNKIRVKRGELKHKVALILKSRFSVSGDRNRVEIGNDVVLKGCRIYIRGNRNRVVIHDGCRLRDVEFWIEDDGGEITMGEHTFVFGRTHLACTEGSSITIGRDCLFAQEITVRTGDSHSIVDRNGRRINHARPVSIGDHVWIGCGVTMLKGAAVADDSVVGAQSLVTKRFSESHVVIAGSPAKIIKTDISWLHERI